MVRRASTRIDRPETPPPAPRPAWSPSSGLEAAAYESPARRLQLQVEAAMAPQQPKWSARQTTSFLILTNGLFWAGLVYGLRTFF